MVTLQYVGLVEEGTKVFEAEIGYLTSRINNTLVCPRVFLGR